jgi:hypothetical protein
MLRLLAHRPPLPHQAHLIGESDATDARWREARGRHTGTWTGRWAHWRCVMEMCHTCRATCTTRHMPCPPPAAWPLLLFRACRLAGSLDCVVTRAACSLCACGCWLSTRLPPASCCDGGGLSSSTAALRPPKSKLGLCCCAPLAVCLLSLSNEKRRSCENGVISDSCFLYPGSLLVTVNSPKYNQWLRPKALSRRRSSKSRGPPRCSWHGSRHYEWNGSSVALGPTFLQRNRHA